MSASTLVHNMLPPALVRMVREIQRHLFPVQKVFPTYEEVLLNCGTRDGYEDEELLSVIVEKTLILKKELESSPVAIGDEATIKIALSLMLATRTNKINVLDFGGACGASYFAVKKILGERYDIHWNVVETPAMCVAAKVFENDHLKFYNHLQPALKAMGSVDFVYSSGTLQCLPHPYKTLKELMEIGAKYLLLARLTFTTGDQDIISRQESMLSHNGKGALPKGFKDRKMYYPHTNMQEEKFNELIHQGYNTSIKFEDVSGIEPVHNESIIGYTILLQKTT